MKRGFALFLLSLAPAWCQLAKPAALASNNLPAPKAAPIPAQTLSLLERTFNDRLVKLAGTMEPVDLLGDTRGLQLNDYGVVFTSEVSLVVTPAITPFMQKISPELAARVHQRRVERLPLLKAAMQEMMRNMASVFTPQVPADQKIVLAVRLYYGAWENTAGMPSQVIMRADRASAAAGKVETEER